MNDFRTHRRELHSLERKLYVKLDHLWKIGGRLKSKSNGDGDLKRIDLEQELSQGKKETERLIDQFEATKGKLHRSVKGEDAEMHSFAISRYALIIQDYQDEYDRVKKLFGEEPYAGKGKGLCRMDLVPYENPLGSPDENVETLLAEGDAIENSISGINETIDQAAAAKEALARRNAKMGSVVSRVTSANSKLPLISGVLNAIARQKRMAKTMIWAAVVFAVFVLLFKLFGKK